MTIRRLESVATLRSPVEVAAAWSLAIAGLLVLARALLELVEGLAELPGAGEHWAGDVVMWLVFVLPIPILAGVTLLAAARWLWRHRIGARGATAVWLVLVGIGPRYGSSWTWRSWSARGTTSGRSKTRCSGPPSPGWRVR